MEIGKKATSCQPGKYRGEGSGKLGGETVIKEEKLRPERGEGIRREEGRAAKLRCLQSLGQAGPMARTGKTGTKLKNWR